MAVETQKLPPVITVDGPSGTGKGTVGLQLAARLGWHFLDSGALYRALGLAAGAANVALDDVAGLAGLALAMDIQFLPKNDGLPGVSLRGVDVSESLRAENTGEIASKIAVIPEVRQALLQKQHEFRQFPGLVADGRDMGTVVFVDAVLKLFLTASAEERAQRRYKQLKEKGFDVNLARLLGEVQARDQRDETREISPLRPAKKAAIIDTTTMTIAEVVDYIGTLLPKYGLG